jgi:spore germination protein
MPRDPDRLVDRYANAFVDGSSEAGRRRERGPRGGRRPRRRLPVIVLIILVGCIAMAAAFALASALDDDRPHGPYLVGGWTFGDRASLDAAVKAGAIDEVSVDWLQSRTDGSVAAPRFDAGFIAAAKRRGCRVFATLTDYDESQFTFDPAITAAILETPASRRRHAAAVAAWCKTNDVDGVDVDWEAIKASDRDAFSAFVEELAQRLHDDSRLIAVDVVPKFSETGSWDTPRAQDWARLGRAVDQFRVMTYNYSGSWSGPGPLSPPDWMDRVLSFAESQVPARRIIMGLGFYGRDWQGSTTRDLVWDDVQAIRKEARPKEMRTASGELYLRYGEGGNPHEAYFPDAVAVRAKLAMLLSRHPLLRGVYAWQMGQEDPRAWRELTRALHH